MSPSRRSLLLFVLPLGLLAAVQLVPYGRAHGNPPAGPSPAWDSPRTLELARKACFDCHSNETRWPWYARIAPLSWRIQNHVEEGREKLNFSDFRPGSKDVAEAAGEAGETVTKQEMPPFDYKLAHAESRLTPEERAALARGLEATFAAYAERPRASGGTERGGRVERGESDDDEAREHDRRGRR